MDSASGQAEWEQCTNRQLEVSVRRCRHRAPAPLCFAQATHPLLARASSSPPPADAPQVPAFPGTLEVPCAWNSPVMAPRFTDAPRPSDPLLADPLEVAAQRAAQERALANAAQEERLRAARQSIQQTVVQLMVSPWPLLGSLRQRGIAAGSLARESRRTHPRHRVRTCSRWAAERV